MVNTHYIGFFIWILSRYHSQMIKTELLIYTHPHTYRVTVYQYFLYVIHPFTPMLDPRIHTIKGQCSYLRVYLSNIQIFREVLSVLCVYSKPPIFEPSSCNLSRMGMCISMSNPMCQFTCLVYVVILYKWLHFCVLYCTVLHRVLQYSIFIPSPGCPKASVKAAVMQLAWLRKQS